MRDIRIAVVVCNAHIGANDLNRAKMQKWVQAAQKRGVEIVCFPEMNISGYGVHPSISSAAEPIPGPTSRCVKKLCNETQITLLAGMAEKDASGNLFVTHLVARPHREIGIYRKLHLSPPEQALYHQGDAAPLFKIKGFCFGVQLCYDAHFPELTTRMALNGADAIFIPHASPRGSTHEKMASWMRHLTARAFDNALFIIAGNQTGSNGEGLTFPGVAAVIDPSGHVIETYASDQEGLLVVELKADALDRVRRHPMRFFLPNRRPELYCNETI